MANLLVWSGVALLLIGLLALLWARLRWTSAGLPRGRVVYSDTGKWERQNKPLYSRRYRLAGRPDYLVRTRRSTVPVEIKSGPAPSEPHEGHVLQLAAYCLLVAEDLGQPVPYGLIHYDDATFEIPYDRRLEDSLLEMLADMRTARMAGSVDRDHEAPQRCLRCGQRDNCDQRLG